MKKTIPLLLIVIVTQFLSGESIDALIRKLQNAPVNQRYKLMNAIKREIVKMNLQARREALQKLLQIHNTRTTKRQKHSKQSVERIKRQIEHEVLDRTERNVVFFENDRSEAIEENLHEEGNDDD